MNRIKHIKMKYLLIITSIFFILSSCNNNPETTLEDDIIIENDKISDQVHKKTVKKIFYNVPSPLEISSMLKTSGTTYNSGYLNSFKKVNNYTTIEEMSINLGIYGADLSYNRLYDQIQESVNYFSAIKKLSDNLGIPQEHGGVAAERLESNLENRDSLLTIISQTYSNADQYLKQNERGNIASLIIMGGWIEALYIATQIASLPGDNKILLESIAEQKLSLENLIGLLSDYKDDEIVSLYIPKLQKLQESYKDVEIIQTTNTVTTDKKTGITIIDNETTINISNESFIEIMTQISEIRNSII